MASASTEHKCRKVKYFHSKKRKRIKATKETTKVLNAADNINTEHMRTVDPGVLSAEDEVQLKTVEKGEDDPLRSPRPGHEPQDEIAFHPSRTINLEFPPIFFVVGLTLKSLSKVPAHEIVLTPLWGGK